MVKLYPSWALYSFKQLRLLRAYFRHKFDKTYYRVWTPWFLEKNQWNDEEEIKKLQLEGLKSLLKHAKKNTSFYKDYPEIDRIIVYFLSEF